MESDSADTVDYWHSELDVGHDSIEDEYISRNSENCRYRLQEQGDSIVSDNNTIRLIVR